MVQRNRVKVIRANRIAVLAPALLAGWFACVVAANAANLEVQINGPARAGASLRVSTLVVTSPPPELNIPSFYQKFISVNGYASINPHEYFAEGVQSWFDNRAPDQATLAWRWK